MQLGEPRLGIDYGTAYTQAVLAWPDGRFEPLLFDGAMVLPSAVHTGAAGGVLVGDAAWRHAAIEPAGFVPRAATDTIVAQPATETGTGGVPADSAVATLARVAAVAAARVGAPVGEVRMVVPAGWGPRRRTWLRQAAYRAGLGQPRLVEAPVAAADRLLAVGVQVPVGAFLVMCDLGAGCEVSVLRRGPTGFEVLSTLADPHAGADAIDDRLIAALSPSDAAESGLPAARDGSWWATLASVRTARELLSHQTVVSVPMPAPAPAMVLHAQLVQEVAEPVLKQAADLAVQAVSAAELTPAQLAGVYLIGGAAATPAAPWVIGEALGVPAQPVAHPGFAAVLGAADAGAGATASAPAAQPPVPPLRRLYGILVPGVLSLVLFAHMMVAADFHHGNPRMTYRDPYYYVTATWGELATAALFAVIACVAAGSLFAAALDQSRRHAVGGQLFGGERISGGGVLAVTAGTAVAALYGVAATLYFSVPLSGPLRWALLPVLPTAVLAGAVAWSAQRRQHPPQGWDAALTFPLSSIICAGLGTLVLSVWWSQLPYDQDIIGRFGGIGIGVGIALAIVRHPGLRIACGLFLGMFGFLAVGPGATGILAVIYATAAALWWAHRLWSVTRLPVHR